MKDHGLVLGMVNGVRVSSMDGVGDHRRCVWMKKVEVGRAEGFGEKRRLVSSRHELMTRLHRQARRSLTAESSITIPSTSIEGAGFLNDGERAFRARGEESELDTQRPTASSVGINVWVERRGCKQRRENKRRGRLIYQPE